MNQDDRNGDSNPAMAAADTGGIDQEITINVEQQSEAQPHQIDNNSGTDTKEDPFGTELTGTDDLGDDNHDMMSCHTLEKLFHERDIHRMEQTTPSELQKLLSLLRYHLPRITLFDIFAKHYWKAEWKDVFLGDLAAGFVVAVMLVPQGLAYALLAEVDVKFGLTSGILGVLLYSLFGSSSVLAVGPTAVVSLLTAEALMENGFDPDDTRTFARSAGTLAFFVGLFTLLMAIVIGSSQLNKLFGIPSKRSSAVYNIWIHVFRNLDESQLETVYLAIENLIFLLILKYGKKFLQKKLASDEGKKKYPAWMEKAVKAFPSQLLVVIVNILIVVGFDLSDKVKTVGSLEGGWVSLENIFEGDIGNFVADLLPSIIIISLLGFMESVSVAKTYALKRSEDIDVDQELVGLGAANLFGGLLGAFPLTGGISRTAVNADAGARTQAAGLFTGCILTIIIFSMLPLLKNLPDVTLAAIIIVAVAGMMDFSIPFKLWRVNKGDFSSWLITIALTLIVGVEPGIVFGTLFSLLVVLKRAGRPHYAVLGRMKSSDASVPVYRNIRNYPYSTVEEENIRLLRFDNHLFFANAEYFADCVTKLALPSIDRSSCRLQHGEPKVVGIDMGGMADVDYTSLQILHELPSSVGKNIMKKHTQIIKNLRQSQLANLEQNQGLEDSLSLENLKIPSFVLFSVRIPVVERFVREKKALKYPIEIKYAEILESQELGTKQVPYFVFTSHKGSKMVILFDDNMSRSLDLHEAIPVVKSLIHAGFFG